MLSRTHHYREKLLEFQEKVSMGLGPVVRVRVRVRARVRARARARAR